MDVFVARQPIFTADQQVFGYELLFRSGPENFFAWPSADEAASRVLSDSLFVFGTEWLTAGKRIFLNVTQQVLERELIHAFQPERVVVELLETVEATPAVIEACAELKRKGYMIALDDYAGAAEVDALAAAADIVKIDFLAVTGDARRKMIERFAPRGIKLLAEKVETQEDYAEAKKLGYAYFQGYFFCRPKMITGKDIPASKLAGVRLLAELSRPEVEMAKVEAVLRSDPSLSTKLLGLLNSAAFGLPRKVTSLAHALNLLGETQLRRWGALLALTGMAADRSPELVVGCLVRARFCELIGKQTTIPEGDVDLFLLGLLAGIDALIGCPLPEFLERLPITEGMRRALIGTGDPLSQLVELERSYARGEWAAVSTIATRVALDEARVATAYRDAVDWTDQVCRAA